LVALADNDFEHAGHDLGSNILGHLHPTRFGHSACRLLSGLPSSSCISNHNIIGHRGARARAGGVKYRGRSHEILVSNLTGAQRPDHE
jgi:hypothetical protein